MAKTPAEIDALPNYTNAQMVKLVRAAIAELVSDPDASVDLVNQSWTVHDLDKLRLMLRDFERAAAADARQAATAAGGGAGVAEFGGPTA
jgi:hypothetical protein